MRGIADKSAHLLFFALGLFHRGLQLRQHDIQCAGQLAYLGVLWPLGNTFVQVTGGNFRGRLFHHTQRPQSASNKPESGYRNQHQDDHGNHELHQRQAAQQDLFGVQIFCHHGDNTIAFSGHGAPLGSGIGFAGGVDSFRRSTDDQLVDLRHGLIRIEVAHRAIGINLDKRILCRRTAGQIQPENISGARPAVLGCYQLIIDLVVQHIAHHGRDRDGGADNTKSGNDNEQHDQPRAQRHRLRRAGHPGI